jgi:Tol biopolymer transport system component
MLHLRHAIIGLAACAVCACSDNNPIGPGEFVGVRIIAGSDVADTVDTRLTQALVVELRDQRGDPVADHPLRFTTVPVNPDLPSAGHTAYVSAPDGNDFGTFAADRTDSQGRARVLVQVGRKAGPALVIVTDPDQATADTATFTVQPGAAVRVLSAPEDTSVYVGKTMTLRSGVVDRFGNLRPDPATHAVIGTEVSVSGSTVTGVALGTALIVTTAGQWADTTTVSVPPEGVLAAFTPRGLATFKTDGSEFRVLVSESFLSGITTAWSPSGTEVAFDHSFTGPLRIASLTTGVRAVSPGTAWSIYPAYSPDGEWVYYSRGGWRLYRVHPDGTGDELVPMTAPSLSDAAPSLSPSGAQLVFVRISAGDQLWMLDLASGVSASLNVFGHQPAWSPSGSLIAYLALNESSSIKVMNPDGTGARTVSRAGSFYAFGHDWSPDSEWIVARNTARNRLEVLNVTTGQTILLGGTAGFNGPSWKP